MGKEDTATEEDVGTAGGEKLDAIDEGRIKPLTAKLIDELVIVDLASVFVQHYAPIFAAFYPSILRPITSCYPQPHEPRSTHNTMTPR